MGKLNALQVKNLTEPGRYSDGEGLILKIGPTGGKSWILRVQVNGCRRDIGLGDAKAVSLRDAREAASELRKLARSGIDPLAAKKRHEVVIPTFREASRLVHAELCKGWKNGKHTDQWLTTIEKYAWSRLGDLKVNEIEGPIIRDVLAEIWLEIPETARRVKQRIGTVLDWCYAKGYRPSEAPMRSLARGLPRQPRKDGHFAAMDYGQVPSFLADLQDRKLSISRLALELLILTATRSGEVRGARWDELNADCTVWTIPAERMKAGKAHSIPLSPQAVDLFRQASHFRIATCDLIFPGQSGKAPMSDMTLLQLLRGHEPHGHRARLPLELSRLGCRPDRFPARGRRSGAGPYAREQGRGGLSPHRLFREAQGVDGGMGPILPRQDWSCSSGRTATRGALTPHKAVKALDNHQRCLADLDGLDLA
jgi:integrase